MQLARINEAACIGCGKCIPACPVDAIIGAARLMHTVVAEECIGCKLCIKPCPVDCIDLLSLPLPKVAVRHSRAAQARERHANRKQRMQQKNQTQETKKSDRKIEISAIIERMKQLKNHERSKPFSAV